MHDQLERLAKRAALGLARNRRDRADRQRRSHHRVLNRQRRRPLSVGARTATVTVLDQYHINPLFDATEDATEEAVINALLAGQTTVGRDGNTVYGLPHDRLLQIMHRYGH